MVVGGVNADGLLDDVEVVAPKPNDECSKAVGKISGDFSLRRKNI
jgi:hypothetical protein